MSTLAFLFLAVAFVAAFVPRIRSPKFLARVIANLFAGKGELIPQDNPRLDKIIGRKSRKVKLEIDAPVVAQLAKMPNESDQ